MCAVMRNGLLEGWHVCCYEEWIVGRVACVLLRGVDCWKGGMCAVICWKGGMCAVKRSGLLEGWHVCCYEEWIVGRVACVLL